jgi:type IV secretion system protein VirB10
MSIKLSTAVGPAGLSRAQLAALALVGVVGIGGSGFLIYRLASGPRVPAAVVSPDEAKLAARAEEKRARAEADARKLRQQDLGAGYQFDSQGNLLGANTDSSELPQNRPLQAKASDGASTAATAIGRGIERGGDRYDDDEDYDIRGRHGRGSRAYDDDGDDPVPSPKGGSPGNTSMLGYSTVAGAAWAARRPENGAKEPPREGASNERGPRSKDQRQSDALDRLVDTMERSTRAATEQVGAPGGGKARGPQGPATTTPSGAWGGPAVSPGPSTSGDDLYAEDRPARAKHAPQPFEAGGIGDMRIGRNIGPDQVVRQGKFLDCALVNQIRADLVDSPVIAMVSRDYVSLDGKFVLVPAGSKLIGEAGRVQNLQQERVYIKFERVIFPDQRSAYFPVRKVPAVDRMGAAGVDGDVDRHLMLQFGAAVMLGVLDGIGAAVQSPSAGSNPTVRDMVMARTSGNFSTVIGGVIQKYANVVPTVTVEPGAKMKVFFAEDVRMSPYMSTRDLTWARER